MHFEPNWQESMRFDFVRLPKALYRQAYYHGLSNTAKTLYAFLLDRSSLSWANGEQWMDENGNCFVYYTLEEITQRFGCGYDKATALLNELTAYGLIIKTRKAIGKPYRIVVKPFITEESDCALPEIRTDHSGKTGLDTPEKSDCTVRKNRIGQSGKPGLNNTEYNHTEINHTDINHTDAIKLATREAIEREIQDQIAYEILIDELEPQLVNGLVNIMTDTLYSQAATEKLMHMTLPGEVVRKRLRELDDMHIRYIADRLKNETTAMRNMRCYLLTLLYEAPDVMDTYYTLRVNRDMQSQEAAQTATFSGHHPLPFPPKVPQTSPLPWDYPTKKSPLWGGES